MEWEVGWKREASADGSAVARGVSEVVAGWHENFVYWDGRREGAGSLCGGCGGRECAKDWAGECGDVELGAEREKSGGGGVRCARGSGGWCGCWAFCCGGRGMD